jgi:two-component system, OmpR family, response regulator
MKTIPTVLLVDDDADFIFQHKAKLEKLNFNVMEASSVNEALEVMETQKPDIAIIDLMMDEMDDGFVLAHHIKKRNPEIPIIMATAVAFATGYEFHKDSAERKNWIKVDVILPKPLRFEQLKTEMKKLGY